MADQTETPDPADEAALDAAADVLLNRVRTVGITPAMYDHGFWRENVAAAAPHLTGPLVEEITRLRAQVAHLTKLHDERDTIERSRMFAVPRETPAPEPAVEQDDEIDEFHPDYCPSDLAFDGVHSSEYFKRDFACTWCHAEPPAVLAETPATTTEEG